MLRFASKPTRAAAFIVEAALSYLMDDARMYADDADWRDLGERTHRCFSATVAADTAERLLEAHASEFVHQLTDYHWLLLYQACSDFFIFQNDEVMELYMEDFPRPARAEDSYWLTTDGQGRITLDFGPFIDAYFWDEDFNLSREQVEALGINGRETVRMNEETWSVVQELAPHPKDLRIVRDSIHWHNDGERP